MSDSDLKVCPKCGQAIGAWRPRCVCDHKFFDPVEDSGQEVDSLIRAIEGVREAPRSRTVERDSDHSIRQVGNSAAPIRHPAKTSRHLSPWLPVGAIATIATATLACFQYGPSGKNNALIQQAQSFTDTAQANYELALAKRETCELVMRAWNEHQRIEELANSIVMKQDVYSRDKSVKDAWNGAANKIDDIKDRLQGLVTRCAR